VGKKPLVAEEQSCGESYTVTAVISYGNCGICPGRHQGTQVLLLLLLLSLLSLLLVIHLGRAVMIQSMRLNHNCPGVLAGVCLGPNELGCEPVTYARPIQLDHSKKGLGTKKTVADNR
jgi:predicted metal-binding protein